MTQPARPDRALSIWQPVHLGTDELGQPARVTLAARTLVAPDLAPATVPQASDTTVPVA